MLTKEWIYKNNPQDLKLITIRYKIQLVLKVKVELLMSIIHKIIFQCMDLDYTKNKHSNSNNQSSKRLY